MWLLSITIVLSFLYYFNIIQIPLIIVSSIITIILQVITLINYLKKLNLQKDINIKKHKVHNLKDLNYILFNTEYYLNKVKS